jgi:hypothetical protein
MIFAAGLILLIYVYCLLEHDLNMLLEYATLLCATLLLEYAAGIRGFFATGT